MAGRAFGRWSGAVNAGTERKANAIPGGTRDAMFPRM